MEIEVGKAYRTRAGRKAIVHTHKADRKEFPYIGLIDGYTKTWRADGIWNFTDFPSEWDLVAEWVDAPTKKNNMFHDEVCVMTGQEILDRIAKQNVVTAQPAQQGLSLLGAVQSGKEFRPVGGYWKCGSESGWFEWNAAEGAVCYAGGSKEMWIDQEVLTTRYELRTDPVPPAAPQGLSLLEAMESGKPFRMIGDSQWFYVDADGYTCWVDGKEMLVKVAGLTARYELKPDPVPPKSVQVTAADISQAWTEWQCEHGLIRASTFRDHLIKHLGLGDDK